MAKVIYSSLLVLWSAIFYLPSRVVISTWWRMKYDLSQVNAHIVFKMIIFILWNLYKVLFIAKQNHVSFSLFFGQIQRHYPQVSFTKLTLGNVIRFHIQSLYLIVFLTPRERVEYQREQHNKQGAIVRFISPKPLSNVVTALYRKHVYSKVCAVGNDVQGQMIRIYSKKPSRYFLSAVAILLTIMTIVVPFAPETQLYFSLVLWAVALWLGSKTGRVASLMMMLLSVIVSTRYIWWRVNSSLNWDDTTGLILGVGLLLAELYTWLILIMGYMQTAWPLERKVVPLPKDNTDWPSVDIYLPIYDEPLKVLQPTVLAALKLDWPEDKLNIYVLDDGQNPEIEAFCRQVNVNYLIRPDNSFAKAGNLNHAMTKTDGDYIAIFDCDHVPVRSFLQMTMGGFITDNKLALVQTPHHFFSADPFERNIVGGDTAPNESSLFYGQVQDGNDLWNATFFCGSCAVLRRSMLEEIGGIATETVTEDAHTALKLHKLGYNTSYINLAQAAGLATESISAHIGQRIRWARGMIQIFRLDNPLLAKGLSFMQRICYSNGMLHFFYGIPRLVFLTAPLAFLIFGAYIIYAPALTIFLYVLPAMFHANLTNSKHQGKYRNSFWAEMYETVLAWYIFRPTLVALLNPKKGKFNVTEKGGLINDNYFDWGIGRPYLFLVVLNVIGIGFGFWRILYGPNYEVLTVLMNVLWTLYNLMILGGALAVITESQQIRKSHRVDFKMPVMIKTENGYLYEATMLDYSESGLAIDIRHLNENTFKLKQKITVMLTQGTVTRPFELEVKFLTQSKIGAEFIAMTANTFKTLVSNTFSRADAWESNTKKRDPEVISQRLYQLCQIGMTGYHSLFIYSNDYCSKEFPKVHKLLTYFITYLPKKPSYV